MKILFLLLHYLECKFQVFLGTMEREIDGYKKVETKAVQKSAPNDMCKKQYAYVYTNK